MKRSIAILAVLLTIPVLVETGIIGMADANPVGIFYSSVLPSITIQSDGSVAPQTEYIRQEGRVYYLTQNLSQSYRLVINCSNMVLDGQGNTINGSKAFHWDDYYWLNSQSTGINLENVNNVTIRDIIVIGFDQPSIQITKCSDVTMLRVLTDASPMLSVTISGCIWIEESNGNTISNCFTGIRLMSGSNNHIFNNTLYLNIDSSYNSIYQNNINVNYFSDYANNRHRDIIIGGGSSNTWNNGAEGNYWSDYNGTDANNDGIGDTPYTIDNQEIDYYPLIKPVNQTYYLLKTNSSEVLVYSPLNQTYKAPPESLIAGILLVLAVTSITLVYFKRRRGRTGLQKV